MFFFSRRGIAHRLSRRPVAHRLLFDDPSRAQVTLLPDKIFNDKTKL